MMDAIITDVLKRNIPIIVYDKLAHIDALKVHVKQFVGNDYKVVPVKDGPDA